MALTLPERVGEDATGTRFPQHPLQHPVLAVHLHRILWGRQGDNTTRLLDLATGRVVRTLRGSLVAVGPNGTVVTECLGDRRMYFWDVVTGQVAIQRTVQDVYPECAAFGPDGTSSATGQGTITIRSSGRPDTILDVGYVHQLLFAREGSTLITVDSNVDKGGVNAIGFETRLWDCRSGRLLGHLQFLQGGTSWIFLTPDGRYDGSEGVQELVQVFVAGRRYALGQFDRRFYQPKLLRRILSGDRPPPRRDLADLPLPPQDKTDASEQLPR